MPIDVHIAEDSYRGQVIKRLATMQNSTPEQVIERIIDEGIRTRSIAEQDETPTMRLMRSWLEEDATDDAAEMRSAEQELVDFKRSMNLPRKEAGARLLYPEVES